MKETYLEDMKFLIKELHKEWSRSGKKKKSIPVTYALAEKIKLRIAGEIAQKEKLINSNSEISFMESIKLSKESFVMLRIIKKLDKKMKKEEGSFILNLDNEEYEKYVSLTGGN